MNKKGQNVYCEYAEYDVDRNTSIFVSLRMFQRLRAIPMTIVSTDRKPCPYTTKRTRE